MRRLLSATALLSLFLVPSAALAYATPEQVLFDEEFLFPPTARDVQERVDRQAETSRERREEAQEREFARQHPAAPEESAHASGDTPEERTLAEVLEELQKTLSGMDSNDPAIGAGRDRREARILERVYEEQQSLYNAQTLGYGGTLHSGAPLSDTGPGTALLVMAVLSAIGWTLRRAGRRQTL